MFFLDIVFDNKWYYEFGWRVFYPFKELISVFSVQVKVSKPFLCVPSVCFFCDPVGYATSPEHIEMIIDKLLEPLILGEDAVVPISTQVFVAGNFALKSILLNYVELHLFASIIILPICSATWGTMAFPVDLSLSSQLGNPLAILEKMGSGNNLV